MISLHHPPSPSSMMINVTDQKIVNILSAAKHLCASGCESTTPQIFGGQVYCVGRIPYSAPPRLNTSDAKLGQRLGVRQSRTTGPGLNPWLYSKLLGLAAGRREIASGGEGGERLCHRTTVEKWGGRKKSPRITALQNRQ